MLQNIDMDKLNAIREHDPEAGKMIDTILEKHKEVVSTIGHELRNPLTYIYGNLQLLADEHPEVKEYRHFNAVYKETQFMTTVLEDLTSYNHSKTVRKELFEPTRYLAAFSLSQHPRMIKAGIQFDFDVPLRLSPWYADPNKLKQVLYNLVNNAKDAVYAHTFGPPCAIHMSARQEWIGEKDYIIIDVEDNGIGIEAENLETIFEPFRTFKPNGTGLGLAVCRSIIEAHCGTLTVQSIPKKGSTFTITIPTYPYSDYYARKQPTKMC
ncbi:MAG: HAMP domain-containing sensor histidine kinase [Eubacteriales bacterium]